MLTWLYAVFSVLWYLRLLPFCKCHLNYHWFYTCSWPSSLVLWPGITCASTLSSFSKMLTERILNFLCLLVINLVFFNFPHGVVFSQKPIVPDQSCLLWGTRWINVSLCGAYTSNCCFLIQKVNFLTHWTGFFLDFSTFLNFVLCSQYRLVHAFISCFFWVITIFCVIIIPLHVILLLITWKQWKVTLQLPISWVRFNLSLLCSICTVGVVVRSFSLFLLLSL
jgi:hypothetical protein